MLLYLSLISILVNLGVLSVFEFELGFRFICFPRLSLFLLYFLVWLCEVLLKKGCKGTLGNGAYVIIRFIIIIVNNIKWERKIE